MSHVFYKFKSQRDPSQVVFDGPGISVFDLKREIITLNKLGNGTDFDLAIYDESTNEGSISGGFTHGEEYTDDTALIPRATSIIVRRLPPSRPGKGNAAKYVTGSASTGGRNQRSENFGKKKDVTAKSNAQIMPTRMVLNSIPGVANAQIAPADEDAAIQMMMSAQEANWTKQGEQMAGAAPVYVKHRKTLQPIPDKPLPQGYVCRRCNEKGHWLQACPTNDDPNYENKPRIKRTTGIPKTFLKKAEKPVFDDDTDVKTNRVMLDADGEYVVVEPDSKSWATYQAKTSASEGDVYSQPLPDIHKDWQCQICNKLVKDATRTPCCKKLFCDEDIQAALLDNDFVCPGCGANEILLDDLVVDEDVKSQVAEYVKKWEEERKAASPPEIKNVLNRKKQTNKQESLSPPPSNSRKRSRSPTPGDNASIKKVNSEEAPSTSKSPPAGPAAVPNNGQFDPFLNQQFNNMPPFMPGMPFPPFPPDPFMMAAMGFPPPPMPGMMPGMPMMGPGMFPQQGFLPPMGNQQYGGENSAYMRRPVNDRGVRRMQRNENGNSNADGRKQADYREVI
jgi:protein MPE1